MIEYTCVLVSVINIHLVAITVTFNQTSYSFNEGTRKAQPVITFSNPSSFDIVINVTTNDITATGVNDSECVEIDSENDYLYGVYSVIIQTSTTFQVVDIPICDDIVLERNETFSLTIVSNSHPHNVTSGSPDHITITVVDNDRKFLFRLKSNYFLYCAFVAISINLQPLQNSFDEGDGVIQVPVNFSNPSYTDITVLINTSNNSAVSEFCTYLLCNIF